MKKLLENILEMSTDAIVVLMPLSVVIATTVCSGCAVEGIQAPLDQVIYTAKNAPDGYEGWMEGMCFKASNQGVFCVEKSATIHPFSEDFKAPVFVRKIGDEFGTLQVFSPQEAHDVTWVASGHLTEDSHVGVSEYTKVDMEAKGLDQAMREGITETELASLELIQEKNQ